MNNLTKNSKFQRTIRKHRQLNEIRKIIDNKMKRFTKKQKPPKPNRNQKS